MRNETCDLSLGGSDRTGNARPGEPMHIVHVWDYFPIELKYHLHYLTDQMTALGHRVTILATDKSNKPWFPFLDEVDPRAGEYQYGRAKVIRLPAWRLFNKQFPKRWRPLRQLLLDLRPDVLHVFGLVRPLTLLAVHCATRLPVRPVIFANDHSHAKNENPSRAAKIYYRLRVPLFRRWIASDLQKVIVPNQASCDYLRERFGIPESCLKIIPLGYDSDQFFYNPLEKNKSDKLVVGFAGKLQRPKRIEWLLEAIGKVQNAADIECHIVGDHDDAYCRELKQAARQLPAEVSFYPLAKPPELARFYNFLDVAIFPGSVSITTQEATGCGTPVVMFEAIPGLEDRVSGGRGYLFRAPDELVKRIDQYLVKKRNGAIDHAAIESASRRWSWKNIVHEYLDEYERALTLCREQS